MILSPQKLTLPVSYQYFTLPVNYQNLTLPLRYLPASYINNTFEVRNLYVDVWADKKWLTSKILNLPVIFEFLTGNV